MQDVVLRFLTFQVVSIHPAIYVGLGGVWLMLLLTAFGSVRSERFGTVARTLWLLFIVLVPLVGLGLYAVRCLICGNWSFLKPILASPKTARTINPR
jgi:hypothetical protein